MCATQAELLASLHRLHQSSDWAGQSSATMANWVALHFGLSRRTARLWLETGEALAGSSVLAEAFAQGRVSFDQALPRSVLLHERPETDWIADCHHISVAQLEQLAGRTSAASKEPEPETTSMLSLRPNPNNTGWRLKGTLTSTDGELVANALEDIRKRIVPETDEAGKKDWLPHDQQLAMALVEMALNPTGENPEPATLLSVHVSAQVLADDFAITESTRGLLIDRAYLDMISCGAKHRFVADGPNGQPVGIGHASRDVPSWLRDQLKQRDRHCQAPGCTNTHFLHPHHVQYWRHHGPTDLDNLILLCAYHHRLLHIFHWEIRGNPVDGWEWNRADGTTIGHGPHPPEWPPELKQRFAALLRQATTRAAA